ncbi:DDE superfamily endonuclease [Paenibacillus sophorae]|uniref:DDE superfamily endonuclease n=1 Tax=Paenibacillus sophorae TaxID=1333845 RepID=A0A1H8VA39_9BACL|nr:DDE superfamily endonuclease [Paenibacillus sophorae]
MDGYHNSTKSRKRRCTNSNGRIIFLLVDDTSCKKRVTTRQMEGLDFHFAHDEGKGVWSHCVVTTHLVCGDQSFAWDFRPYFREQYCQEHNLNFKSKNDLALEMISAFPATANETVYVLMDSWYTSQKMLDACNSRGFHVIADVKTNRKISPAGVRISMSDFAAQYIQNSDLRSVTVGKLRMHACCFHGKKRSTQNEYLLCALHGS